MCLVRDENAVGALQGVWIGLNLFYAGFVVLPQNFLPGFDVGLWINASRYALEGIIFTTFEKLTATVIASELTPFWFYLQAQNTPGCTPDESTDSCYGTMMQFATYYFGGRFSASNHWLDVGMLFAWNILALFGTWFCLRKFNYTNT